VKDMSKNGLDIELSPFFKSVFIVFPLSETQAKPTPQKIEFRLMRDKRHPCRFLYLLFFKRQGCRLSLVQLPHLLLLHKISISQKIQSAEIQFLIISRFTLIWKAVVHDDFYR
jgi:hypothetical protein